MPTFIRGRGYKKAVNEHGEFWCPKCEAFLPRASFDASKKTGFGIQPWCRGCIRDKRIQWHSKPESALLELVRKASRRGKPFSLNADWAIKQFARQNGRCAYTGIEMTFGHGKGRVWTNASIDRMDSAKGYDPENCVLCCAGFNLMKTNLSLDAMEKMCEAFLAMREAKENPHGIVA